MLIAFPVIFTAQKVIPGLVGEPRLMEIERYPQTLLISRDYASDEYITITRFSKAFIHKMLGLDEDLIKWDMYTVEGYRPEAYYTPTQLEEMNRGGEASAGAGGPAVLLSRTEAPVMYDTRNEGFTPPHEYSEEGEPPEQWYDEDYWVYYPDTDEWEFEEWKVEEEANADVTNGRP